MCLKTNKYLIIPNGNAHIERKTVYYHERRIWDHICMVYNIEYSVTKWAVKHDKRVELYL